MVNLANLPEWTKTAAMFDSGRDYTIKIKPDSSIRLLVTENGFAFVRVEANPKVSVFKKMRRWINA